MEIEEHKAPLIEKIHWRKMKALTAVFDNPQHAHEVAQQLMDNNFPMGQISVLHLPNGQDHDFLGVSFEQEKKRTKIWSENGALWGAMLGLMVGAAGVLFVPGVGTLFLLGPVIDLVAGAAIGSGIMAGAAQATRLSTALQHMGIPTDEVEGLRKALLANKTLLILHYHKDDQVNWRQLIDWSSAESVQVFSGNEPLSVGATDT